MHASIPCANSTRYSVFRWPILRLGSRAGSNRVEDFRNPFDRYRSFEITGRIRHARWVFRVVYRFENEQLVELINRTAHAAALSTLVETATAYRFYLGIYVRSVSRFTPLYMALIDPFRKTIVYPSLLRGVRARWNQAFGPNRKHKNLNCRCDKHMLPFSES
jgi:hypothetical protein